MANARRKLNEAPPNLYEQQRLANIADNKRKMDALITPALSNMQQQQGQPKKRSKRIHNTSGAATEAHNLRPRPQRNLSENANEQIDADISCESIGDFLCDNEDFHAPQKKRKGRGITKLEDIFARESEMLKIKIQLNQFGQPVGNNSRKFSSAIGCYVRKKLSVSSVDWRLVDGEKKFEVWTDLKKIYDIDDAAFNWFLSTAGRKWKDFKSTLKEQYFNENLTDVDLKDRQRGRVNDEDWKFLSEYWMSPECEEKTKRAKFSRSQVGSLHTSGSKSFARSGHEMSNELGRPPRRDELYVKTHTRKNGVPTKHAEPVINKLKEIVEAHPELKERTIQQGDAFAAVCGEKEPRGRVRVLGLGPTPQDIGTPGMRSYTPTRLQMEVLARKKAEREKAALEQRIAEMEEKMQEQRMAHEMRNVEIISQNGSNTQHHLGTRSGEHVDETHNIAQFHEDDAYVEDQSSDEGENLLGSRCVSSPAMQSCQGNLVSATPAAHPSQGNPINATRAVQPSGNPTNATPAVQLSQGNPTNGTPAVQPSQGNPSNATLVVQPYQGNTVRAASAIPPLHDELIGKDVILYAMLRDQPVAKGTIISTNPSTVLGGVALGKQYCEVVVNVVLKRDVILPRPYGYMEKMGDADRMSTAWPYKRLKVCKTSKSSQSATGGRS